MAEVRYDIDGGIYVQNVQILPLPLNDAVQEREWGVLEVEGWAAAEAAAERGADTSSGRDSE